MQTRQIFDRRQEPVLPIPAVGSGAPLARRLRDVRAPDTQDKRVSVRCRACDSALASVQKAEIEKWWPIIKAANIKGE